VSKVDFVSYLQSTVIIWGDLSLDVWREGDSSRAEDVLLINILHLLMQLHSGQILKSHVWVQRGFRFSPDLSGRHL